MTRLLGAHEGVSCVDRPDGGMPNDGILCHERPPFADRHAVPSAISLTTAFAAPNCGRCLPPLRVSTDRYVRRSMHPVCSLGLVFEQALISTPIRTQYSPSCPERSRRTLLPEPLLF